MHEIHSFKEPLTIEETAEKYVRPELKQVFIDLCRKPIRDYLNRFGFQSDHLKMMYAATDGFSGYATNRLSHTYRFHYAKMA